MGSDKFINWGPEWTASGAQLPERKIMTNIAQLDVGLIRGPEPRVPTIAFKVRPGLAEQIAQVIECYDALVEDGAAATAERLAAKGALITQGQVDLATRQIEHQERLAQARDAEANYEAYAAQRAEDSTLLRGC